MNGVSKNFNMGKVLALRNFGKIKEDTTIGKTRNESTGETEANRNQIPFIRISQNAFQIPRYASVFSRSSDDGVTMDDLDALQQDLEKLLSSCALRNRYFRTEIESIDKVEEKRDKRGKQTSLKRKRQDDKLKSKDVKNGTRVIKKHGLNMNNFIVETPVRHDVPKVTLPKNDTSEKFWASVEPFCAEIQKDDIAFLDSLIEECSKEIAIKIPEIGEHFASEWSDELIYEEQNIVNAKGNDFKKNGISAILDTLANPKTQSILSTLPATLDKFRVSDLNIFKNYNRKTCMEKRLKKELVEQGILNIEDLRKTASDDALVAEIKKCQNELITVNDYNKVELGKLRNSVAKDLRRQEVKEELDKCDNKIMELYNKVLQAKQKALQKEVEDVDKHLLNEQISKEFETQADSLVEQQFILNRQLLDLSDTSILY